MSSFYKKLGRSSPLGKTCEKHPNREMVGFHVDVWCPECESEVEFPAFFTFMLREEYQLVKAGAEFRSYIVASAKRAEEIVLTEIGMLPGETCFILELKPNYYPFIELEKDVDGSFDAYVRATPQKGPIDKTAAPIFVVHQVVGVISA